MCDVRFEFFDVCLFSCVFQHEKRGWNYHIQQQKIIGNANFQQKPNVILEDGCLIDNRKPVCVGNGAMEWNKKENR